jgi:hypothetical protein
LSHGLHGCRTILKTKKFFPKGLLSSDKDLKFVESDFAMADDILVSKWENHGSKAVLTASNMQNPEERTFVSGRNEGKRNMYPFLSQWLIITTIRVQLVSSTNIIPYTTFHGNPGIGRYKFYTM